MQKSAILVALFAYASNGKRVLTPTSAFQAPGAVRSSRAGAAKMQDTPSLNPGSTAPESLKQFARDLNPAVGYWDPLKLAEGEFFGESNEATVGFLRHAEIKHGRVAMAAFVGYLIQSNNIVFPWKLTGTISYADIAKAGSPPEQWDALPSAAKLQILGFVGMLEFWGENSEVTGEKHYMRGGVPGKYPSFNNLLHPVPLDLYDPFKLNKRESRETMDRKLLAEVNNGRLAMIGIMSFLAEQKVRGSVPVLRGLLPNLKQYSGEIMAPFAASDSALPFVAGMLNAKSGLGDLGTQSFIFNQNR